MLGETFKIMRVFNNLTQQELAKDIGISNSYLSQIEAGNRAPNLEIITAFAKRFGVPVSSLLFFSEQLQSEDGDTAKSRLRFGKKILDMLQKIDRMSK